MPEDQKPATPDLDLDLTGLTAAPSPELLDGSEDPTHPAVLSDDEIEDLAFQSHDTPADIHAKLAAVRMDAMVGELLDLQERQTAALEKIAGVVEAFQEIAARVVPIDSADQGKASA